MALVTLSKVTFSDELVTVFVATFAGVASLTVAVVTLTELDTVELV